MSPPFFNWPPFKLVALDADTGKPLDPTVGMRVYREFYNVKKNKDGKKMIVAHKNGDGSKKGAVVTEDRKKNGGGNVNNRGGNGGNGKGGGEERKDGGGSGEMKPADAQWTAEEDAKLKELKAANKPKKEIIPVLNRPWKDIRERWEKIDPAKGESNAGKKDDGKKKDNGDNKGGNKKEDKKDKKAGKPDKHANNDKEADHKSSAKAPSKAGSGEARFTMGEWMTLQEDDLFSFGELQCLSELIMRDEHQRWLRIASAFADKTGRRVHADDIREKFEELGRMG